MLPVLTVGCKLTDRLLALSIWRWLLAARNRSGWIPRLPRLAVGSGVYRMASTEGQSSRFYLLHNYQESYGEEVAHA